MYTVILGCNGIKQSVILATDSNIFLFTYCDMLGDTAYHTVFCLCSQDPVCQYSSDIILTFTPIQSFNSLNELNLVVDAAGGL